MHLGMLASDEDEELMVATAGPKVAILRESIEVAREANELWRADLQLQYSSVAVSGTAGH